VTQTGSSPGLARKAIGLREVLFQSITHMAPAAAVALSIVVGANFASGALPLSVVFALIGCLLVAVSIGQLARRLPSAGGFYTYASRGLHPAVGFLVGWGYAFVDAMVGLRSRIVPAHVGRDARSASLHTTRQLSLTPGGNDLPRLGANPSSVFLV
jgi:hypothetical protein